MADSPVKNSEAPEGRRTHVSPEDRARRDLIFRNNPVLIGGHALAPVVMAATSLRNAVILSIAVLLIEIPVRILGNLTVGFIPQRLRTMFYALLAAGCYIPTLLVLHLIFNISAFLSVGLYLPLIVCDALVLGRSEIPTRERFLESLRNGILTAVGFSLAICLIGTLRELLANGTLWGISLSQTALPHFPLAGIAAGGFILTALLCAVWQWLITAIRRGLFRRPE